jgi:peroxiredoxin
LFHRLAATVLCLAMTASGCSGPERPASGSVSTERAPAVSMLLDRSDGMPIELADYRGRAVLVIAFVMDDLGSQALLRHAERLATEHPEDLAVIAISGDRHPREHHAELARVYRLVLELNHVDVVLATDEIRQGHSPLGEIERVPTTFLVNRAGSVARKLEGYLTYEDLSALIAPALPSN